MSRNHVGQARSALFLLAPLAFGLASSSMIGCGSRFADSCDASAQCEGGNDQDIDACKAEGDAAADVAAAYDCSEPFDKLLDCIDRTGDCDDGNFSYDCGDEQEALGECEQAASARDGSDVSGGGSDSSSVSTTATSSSSGGSAGACDTLQGVCASCPSDLAPGCQQVLDLGDDNVCASAIDSYTSAGC